MNQSVPHIALRLMVHQSIRASCAASFLLWATGEPAAYADTREDASRGPAPLETIFVSASPGEALGPVSETHHVTPVRDLRTLAPLDVGDLIARLPSARVATNSRGQSIVSLRGAGERQVALFLDGAPLNVPWDNRFDLGVLPAAVIENVRSVSGTLSPQYGVNALGAVALGTRAAHEGPAAEGQLGLGSQGLREGSALLRTTHRGWSFLTAAHMAGQDGDPVAQPDRLPFHQQANALRTNTDRTQLSLLAKIERSVEGGSLAATLLYADVAKGIAPESDRAASEARFWRYPGTETAMMILSGTKNLTERVTLTASGWFQSYGQTIDAFDGPDYRTREARQTDSDENWGVRTILDYNGDSARLTASATVRRADHRQVDQPANAAATASTFAQADASAGLDSEVYVSDHLTLQAALGFDHLTYLKTGAFGETPGFTRPVLRAGLAVELSETVRLRATMGQKSRLPTMRELFGTALNRFLINPALRPERVRTAELGLDYQSGTSAASVILFHQSLKDTIDQIRIGPLRQRINLLGSRIWGVELAGSVDILDQLRLDGQVTYNSVRGLDTDLSADRGRTLRPIAERPDWQARLTAHYRIGGEGFVSLEGVYTGRAFSPGTDGSLRALPTSLQANASLAYPIWTQDSQTLTVAVRIDNILNAYSLPQAGLPAPGRRMRASLRFQF